MALWYPHDLASMTPYAQKYGRAFNEMFGENDNEESGLTPKPYDLDTTQTLPLLEFEQFQDRQDYQKQSTGGFTVADLLACRAIDPPDATDIKPNNLTNEICPVFARKKWRVTTEWSKKTSRRHSEKFQQEFSFDTHDRLWEALLPVLRLASHMLTSNYTCDWWDGLVRGPREDITPDRLPDVPKTIGIYNPQRFLARSPSERHLDGADWQKLTENITWCIASGIVDGGFKDDTGIYKVEYCHGAMRQDPARGSGHAEVLVPYEEIRPLMPTYQVVLSTSERLVQQFTIAVTLLHELAHAVNAKLFWEDLSGPDSPGGRRWSRKPPLNKGNPDPDRPGHYMPIDDVRNNREPYYQDEYVSELGYSMENSLFGGHYLGMIPSGSLRDEQSMTYGEVAKYASFGWAARQYFSGRIKDYPSLLNIKGGLYNQDEELKNPSMSPEYRSSNNTFPVSMRYFEEVQQESFWSEFVTKFGGDRLKCEPKFQGWCALTERFSDEIDMVQVMGEDMKDYTRYLIAKEAAQKNPNNTWIDPEIKAIQENSSQDPSNAHRISRLRRNRTLAAQVHAERRRQSKQKREYEIERRTETMRRELEAWQDRRDREANAWYDDVKERQDDARILAKQYEKEYKIPMPTTFEAFLRVKMEYDDDDDDDDENEEEDDEAHRSPSTMRSNDMDESATAKFDGRGIRVDEENPFYIRNRTRGRRNRYPS